MSNLNKHFEDVNNQLYEFDRYHSKNSDKIGECKLREIFENIFKEISENKINSNATVFEQLSQYTVIVEHLENQINEGFKRDEDNDDNKGDFKADIRDQFYVDWKNNIFKVNDLLNDFWSKNRENIPPEDAPFRKIKTITTLLNQQKETDIKTGSNNNIIITWNEQNNVLTDVFRQLKSIHNKNSEPLIPNSYEELAVFLKNNFSCFSSTKLSTIQTLLKNGSTRPKSDRIIAIVQTK